LSHFFFHVFWRILSGFSNIFPTVFGEVVWMFEKGVRFSVLILGDCFTMFRLFFHFYGFSFVFPPFFLG